MTQGERVKEVRKVLGLTLEKFGEELGVKKNAISQIENGRNSLTDQMAKAICREFRVNYYWLTEEQLPMFTNAPETIIDEIAEEYHLDDTDRKIIETYLELPEDKRQVLKDYFKSVFT